MGSMCASRRDYKLEEMRYYKELTISAKCSEPSVLVQQECIVNIDVDPQNSYLHQIIKEQVQLIKEGESQVDDVSEVSEQNRENFEFQLGKWQVERIGRRFFRKTNYMAHLKIDQSIQAENLGKIYQELFYTLAQKNIQEIVIPTMWIDQYNLKITQRQNADALFEQLFIWRNQDQKYRAAVTVFHIDVEQCYPIVDSFLQFYNQFNPIVGESQAELSQNQDDNDDDENVDEDQKMLK